MFVNHKIGIIGFGAMGKIIAQLAQNHMRSEQIKIVDPAQPQHNFQQSELTDLSDCSLIIIAVSTANLESVCQKLSKIQFLKSPIICSIAATMIHAEFLIKKYLSHLSKNLISHPLFGPATLEQNKQSLVGLEIALTSNNHDLLLGAQAFLSNLGLKTHHVHPEKHDQLMARNHLIPFFISHLLKDYQFSDSPFNTRSFSALKDFLAFTSYNLGVLTEIVQFNPYAQKELELFQQLFVNLEKQLTTQSSI